MRNALIVRIPAAFIAACPANFFTHSCPGFDPGSFLANHYGMTCSAFIDAADTSDPIKLQSYKDIIVRLVRQKWGSLPNDKLSRLVRQLVVECEGNGRSDFETTAKHVVARFG
jgi:hypothetical protein